MKIKTVGLLAGAAMTLTSLTVWSVTPKGGFGERLLEEASAGLALGSQSTSSTQGWKFEEGSQVRIEGRLGHATLPSGRDSETYLYVNVRAPQDAVAATSAPLDLAIVIDRSGSMQGKKMVNALDAARGMVRRLRDGDRVSVVAFNTSPETIVPSTVLDAAARERVARDISTIAPGGDTCISCGLEAGMDQLRGQDGRVKRIMLLSDGEPTAGVRDVEGFRSVAVRARDMGCAVSAIGVDVLYNERIMSTIAIESNGRHRFVEDASGLPQIFDDEMASLTRTVAANAEMRIALDRGVELLDVFDRAFRREGDEVVVPMGVLGAGEEKTVLMRVRLPRGSVGERPVAQVRFGFDDLVEGGREIATGGLVAELSADPSELSELDPLVAARLGRSETAAALRQANDFVARGDAGSALRAIEEAKRELSDRKTALAPKASARRGEFEADLDRQLAALEKADDGFASPPPSIAGLGGGMVQAAPPPAESREGRAQTRSNASTADALGF
jgi:Ca-activated chloride channel family protein